MKLVLLMVLLLLLAITPNGKALLHTLMNSWNFVRECKSKGNQDSRRRHAGYTGYKAKDSRRRPGKQEETKALAQKLRSISPMNDRYAEGMHDVPPPMAGIYIPSGPDVETDDVETNEFVPKLVANEPKAVSDPKVWSDAPIIEEYESDSDDEHVSSNPQKEQETT
ncbi:hypothetical protein Tco_0504971 [Tanacetum coccineum]